MLLQMMRALLLLHLTRNRMQRKLQSIGHACKAESMLQLSLKLKRNPGQHCDNLSQCSIFVMYVGKCRYAIKKCKMLYMTGSLDIPYSTLSSFLLRYKDMGVRAVLNDRQKKRKGETQTYAWIGRNDTWALPA